MTGIQNQTSTWKLDPAHTLIEFSAKHMMISTVKGRFDTVEGTITLDESNIHNSSVVATIDTESVATGDAKRDGHLRSGDFFETEKYPKITFVSKRIDPAGQDKFRVVGDLTIRDVTKEVVLDTDLEGRGTNPWGMEVVAFTATTTINRKDFGLQWNVTLETGGVLVGDNIKINIHSEAIKETESANA